MRSGESPFAMAVSMLAADGPRWQPAPGRLAWYHAAEITFVTVARTALRQHDRADRNDRALASARKPSRPLPDRRRLAVHRGSMNDVPPGARADRSLAPDSTAVWEHCDVPAGKYQCRELAGRRQAGNHGAKTGRRYARLSADSGAWPAPRGTGNQTALQVPRAGMAEGPRDQMSKLRSREYG